jgi:glycosyltransferase involved in cell wall biosynthesis
LGGATAEASALGVPVISTKVGGTTDLVVDGVTGLLVPAGDVEALASAIERLLGDPSYARKLAEAASIGFRARRGARSAIDATWAEYERAMARRGFVPSPDDPGCEQAR